MRILHVLNGTGGGSIVSVLELVKASRAAGTGIEHCAVYPGRPGFEDPEIHRVFHRAMPIPLPAWNSPNKQDVLRRIISFALTQKESGFGIKTARAFDRVIGEWSIDVVTTNCAVNIHGALAARRAGLPHVWHIRERIGTGGSMQFRLDDRRLVQRIAELSNSIATVSEYVAEPFRKYGADAALEVVYDGVDTRAFQNPEVYKRGKKLRRKWEVPENTVLIGKVANLTASVKRHDLFLKAAAEVVRKDKNVRFVIVGAIPNRNTWFSRPSFERWQALRSLANDLGLNNRLVWAGMVPDPPAVMNAIDVLSHACEIEGFPRIALEVMAAGKPIVGPKAGGLVECVLDGAGLLVPQASSEALAHGMLGLLENSMIREKTGQSGMDRVRTRFDISRHLATMVRLYSSVKKSGFKGMARA